MSSVDDSGIAVVLFDLGGVLMDFAGVGRLAALLGEAPSSALDRRWASNPWLHELERGRCSPERFAEQVVRKWAIPLTAAEFLADFARWPAGPFAGAVGLVAELKASVTVGCLSNTNEVHWRSHLQRWGLVEHFTWRFVSHELGVMKPDPRAYDAALVQMGVEPDRVLFLDDRVENVHAARQRGIRARQTCGVAEVRAALAAHGLQI